MATETPSSPRYTPAMSPEPPSNRPAIIWLACVCGLIVSMVVIGGITRLTGAGLSITEWAPVTGAIPPLSQDEWMVAFTKYQATPQFKLVNSHMTIDEFQGIFFWEYIHRLIGRMIGVVYGLPFVWLWWRKRLVGRLTTKLLIGFVLGSLQGLLGWFMVASGLVKRPEVSHFRLAAHLLLALFLLAYLLWILLGLLPRGTRPAPMNIRFAYGVLAALVVLQIMYGAFTAGLKAGYGFNTFPTMNGQWIPSGLGDDIFNDRVAVQFIHRWLGVLLLLGATGVWFYVRKAPLDRTQRLAAHMFSGLVGVQFLLGVATLLLVVPVPLAVMHQLTACLVFTSMVAATHALHCPAARVG